MKQYDDNKTKSKNWPKRLKTIIKYFFVISLSVLACINVVFFIYNFRMPILEINDITIILTVVGFFFAFAGINIYSIFNTNIEEEKERLNNLAINYKKTLEQYNNKIRQTDALFDYSQKLIKFHQLSLLICLSHKYNAQSFNWLIEFNRIMDDYSKFLEELFSDSKNENVANDMQGNFIGICRGSYYSFMNFKHYIEESSSLFFQDVDNRGDRVSYISEIDYIIAKLKDLQVKDFSKIEDEGEKEITEDEISIGQAFKNLFCTIKRKFI